MTYNRFLAAYTYTHFKQIELQVTCCVLATNAFPQQRDPGFDSGFRDLEPQEQQQFAEARDGGSAKTPGGYFQYVNVPAHKEYEFGWNRGNPKHYISRYEQNKDHRFRTRVRHETFDDHLFQWIKKFGL